MSESRKRLTDIAFIIVLMIYILLGVMLVPQHGDEYMLIHMAGDFYTSLHGDWNQLALHTPNDGDQHLRLVNGPITKLTIGLAFWLKGIPESALPTVYAWELPKDENVTRGAVPSVDLIRIARLPSAIFAALAVIPMFLLGWNLRLRALAYPAAALYALHPTLLLNGRRAMMEGAMMFFSLTVMAWAVAMIVAEHDSNAKGFVRRLPMWARYIILGILCGLAVASKHLGLIPMGAALVAVPIASLIRRRTWQPIRGAFLATVFSLVTFFCLNPAYWQQPLAALQQTIEQRAFLLKLQTGGQYRRLLDRLAGIVEEPYLTPAQYYELSSWDAYPDIQAQIVAYEKSTIDGWVWGKVIGVALTILAGLGLIGLLIQAWRKDLIALAILIWTGVTLVYALTIPLAWSRYYIPLILVAILLTANGLGWLIQFVFSDLLDHLPVRK